MHSSHEHSTRGDRGWWEKPRTVSVIVDNPSWIMPHALRLVELIEAGGDHASFHTDYSSVPKGDVAFYLGCVRVAPAELLTRNHRNLVVHESALPQGAGFSPLSWQILEGKSSIPIVLFEMVEEFDAGPIVYRSKIDLGGHELVGELRDLQAQATRELCLRYLSSPQVPIGEMQTGERSIYARRSPKDSRLDPNKTIVEQFDLFRIVDNEKYPAFFELRGCEYELLIRKRNGV